MVSEKPNIVEKIERWGNRHHPKLLDLVRMALGIFLIARGSIFLMRTSYIRDLVLDAGITSSSPLVLLIINVVTYVHLAGGILILLGLWTRAAALLQLPIVLSALFFVNILSSYFNTELWLSILVLILLLQFMVIGSGPWSMDSIIADAKSNRD